MADYGRQKKKDGIRVGGEYRSADPPNMGKDMNDYGTVFEIIKASLWGQELAEPVTEEAFAEMQKQAIAALPAAVLSRLPMTEELRSAWKKAVYEQITYNVSYRRLQASLPITVPYAVLKGSSAAKYYPNPLYRTMGDIDIITRREDFEAACGMLAGNGFEEITNDKEQAAGRHRLFFKDGIVIEAHAYYAYQNDPEKAGMIDDMVINGITPSHELPEDVNGIVLIEHINQHMEDGLGLRQIIDWMMYVDKCLPDEKWPAFRALAEKTGHVKLAAAVTRMCGIYLGLPERKWCAGADAAVCGQLMEYIMNSGNFGRKKPEGSRVSAIFFTNMRSLGGTFRFLQGRGLITWKAAQRHRFLRPFAWLYQAGRYLKKGISRDAPLRRARNERRTADERNRLFDALEVSREEKGIVRYRNGKYSKGL